MLDLERRVDVEVLSRQPQIVVIYIGIHDVWHSRWGGGTPKPEYEAGLRRRVHKMTAARNPVILCTSTVIGEQAAGTNALDTMLDDYAGVTRGVAAETGAELVDLLDAFQRHRTAHDGAAAAGKLTYDGVHLNTAGNRRVAQCIADPLIRIMPCTPTETPSVS